MTTLHDLLTRAEEIEARATPGKWVVCGGHVEVEEAGEEIFGLQTKGSAWMTYEVLVSKLADREFIAASRSLLGPLIAVARAALSVEQEHHQLHLRERLKEALAKLGEVRL